MFIKLPSCVGNARENSNSNMHPNNGYAYKIIPFLFLTKQAMEPPLPLEPNKKDVLKFSNFTLLTSNSKMGIFNWKVIDKWK